jgi:Transcriptional regulator
MEVKLIARTLDLFELFAREHRPLSLTELARGLEVPMSSTLALVRTLAAKGYVYEIRPRGGYYPTRKMRTACAAIDRHDPLLELARPILERLRDASGETVVIGKRVGHQVLYLDVVPSPQAIRYNAEAGQLRPLQANSIGKALFCMLEGEERDKLLAQLQWAQLTPHSLATPQALLADGAAARQRGWASNVGESVPDLAAVAKPVELMGEWYGVSVVGPAARMRDGWERHLEALRDAVEELASTFQPASPARQPGRR